MKGMVFVELLRMAEDALGEDTVDDILDELDLSTGGAYNAVGNYPCSELMQIVEAVSAHSGLPTDQLQRMFGNWIHERFVQAYPAFFQGKQNVLQMLDAIENEVHVEVRKLYPDAELPTFDTHWKSETALQMRYASERPLVEFCHGMIEACAKHFDTPTEITVENQPDADGKSAIFDVRIAG